MKTRIRKVLIISDIPYKRMGGAETVISGLIQALSELGCEVNVIQFGGNNDGGKSDTKIHNPFGSKIFDWQPLRPQKSSNLLRVIVGSFDPIGEAKLLKLINEINPDILYFSCVNSFGYIRAIVKSGRPNIVNFPGYIFACPKGGAMRANGAVCLESPTICNLRNEILKKMVPTPDIITAQSHFIKTLLIKYGYHEKIIRMLHNPVHIPGNYIEKEKWTKKIVYSGRLTEYKGVRDLLQAIRTNQTEGLKLLVCGDGSLKDEVVSYCKGYPNKFQYFGRLDQKDLFKIYQASDAVIIPSKCPESFCIVGAESLGFGLPILGTDVGALKELVEEGVTGLKFYPGNVSSISETIDRLYTNWSNYLKMCQNARKSSLKFGMENFTQQLENILAEF